MKNQNCLSEQWDVKSQVYSGGCEEAVNEFLETNIDIIGGAVGNYISSYQRYHICWKSYFWLDISYLLYFISVVGSHICCINFCGWIHWYWYQISCQECTFKKSWGWGLLTSMMIPSQYHFLFLLWLSHLSSLLHFLFFFKYFLSQLLLSLSAWLKLSASFLPAA